jgi:peptidoglycan/LPS O-acetylase OafA/YrhL
VASLERRWPEFSGMVKMMSALSAASVQTTVQSKQISNRIPAFDFTKGMLVLFMVLYHWLNYFYGPQGDIYKYLRFLTPSFIFVTGFLISHVHFSKYGVGSSSLSKRLFLRGVKLLGVFVALNVLVSLVDPDSFLRNTFSESAALANLDAVFFTAGITSSEAGKVASFGILVPISYVLMLAALFSLACRFFKYTFHAACAAFVLCMVIVDLHGVQSVNLELVSVGLLGVVLGYIPRDQLQRLVSRPWVVVSAYCLYLIEITIWNVSLYTQMAGACLTTLFIYSVGTWTSRQGRVYGLFVLLGKYSLFGYIAQIAILQLLNAGLRHVNHGYTVLVGSFAGGLVLTVISVEVVDRARARSKTLDGAYRAIFA